MTLDPAAAFAELERAAFRMMNTIVEPWVRAGFGGPGVLPSGAIVLEVEGRTSGVVRSVPLLATVVGSCVVAGTYRGRVSQWVKNAIAKPDVRYVLGGRECEARATVFAPGYEAPELTALPEWMRAAVAVAVPPWVAAGWAIVVLTPR